MPSFADVIQRGFEDGRTRNQISNSEDSDNLDFGRGFTFTPQNDLNRLEVISANEGGGVRDRLKKQLDAVEGVVNRDGEDEAVSEASARQAVQSDRSSAQFERSTRGMDLSDRQKRSANKRLGLRRSLNRASVAGATRRGFTDRSKAAASTGAGFSDAFFSQRAAGVTSNAQTLMTATNAENQRRADKAGGTASLIGTGIGAAVSIFSSEGYKHNLGKEKNLLDKLKKVRVNRWQYKGDDKTHVGPFSEEFNREFGMDTDRNDMINVIDALGVTLGAVKELDEKVSQHGR